MDVLHLRRHSCPACGRCSLRTYSKPLQVTIICQGPLICNRRLNRKQCSDKRCRAVIGPGFYSYPADTGGSNDDVEPSQHAKGRAKQRELHFFDDPDEAYIRVKPNVFIEVSLLQQLRVALLRLRPSVQGLSDVVLATSSSGDVGGYPWLATRQFEDLRGLLDAKGQWLQQALDMLVIMEQTQVKLTAPAVEQQQQQTQLQQVEPQASDEDPEAEQAPEQLEPIPQKLFVLVEHPTTRDEVAAAAGDDQDMEAAGSMYNSEGSPPGGAAAAAAAEDDDFDAGLDEIFGGQAGIDDFELSGSGALGEDAAAAHAADTEPAGTSRGMPFGFAGATAESPAHSGAGTGSGQQQQQQQEPQQQQEQQPAMAEQVPRGTLAELLRCVVVQDIIDCSGNMSLVDHCRCFCTGVSQPHPLTLIVDCTTNITVRACAVPNCKQSPFRDQMWCKHHQEVSRGCQVAVCDSSSGEWSPCDQQPRGSDATCSRHRAMDSKGGCAAGFEVRGYITPGRDRRDKMDTQALRQHQQHKAGVACWRTPAQATAQPEQKTPTAAATAGRPRGTPALFTPEEAHPAAAQPASASAGRAHTRINSQAGAAAATTAVPAAAATPHSAACTSSPVMDQPTTPNTGSSSRHGFQPDAVFVGGKATRPVLVCSCAHCGGVVGFNLLWHGAHETSYRGLQDVLQALEGMLRRMATLPQPAAAAAARGGGAAANSASNSGSIVVIYNDAAAMQSHWQQLEPLQRQKYPMVSDHVRWAIDPFRFLPVWTAAVRQAAESVADEEECSTPELPNKRRRVGFGADGSSQHTPATPDPAEAVSGSPQAAGKTASSQAVATPAQTAQHTLQMLSPLRSQLKGRLWEEVKVPHSSPLFKGIAKLLQPLPVPLDDDWHRQCAAPDDSTQLKSIRWLLCRSRGARLSPGVVSFNELEPFLVDALLTAGQQADKSKRSTVSKRLLQQLSVPHERLFFQFSPPADAGKMWTVKVMAMLVDAEAVEGLWRQMQPGTTLRLKSQTHALVELAAWLQLHDRKQHLYQQYILQRQQEHLRATGQVSPDLRLPTLREWKLMTPRLTAQLNLVTGPPTQEALEKSRMDKRLREAQQHAAELEQQLKQLRRQHQQQKQELEQRIEDLEQHIEDLEQQHHQQVTDPQQQVEELEDEPDPSTGGSDTQPRFDPRSLRSRDFAPYFLKQMLGRALVSGLLYTGLKHGFQADQRQGRTCDMLTTEELVAISTSAQDHRIVKCREAALEVIGQLRSAAESGHNAHLLLPIYCPEPQHHIAGVLNMGSGQLDVYDSYEEVVNFDNAPANGGVPAYVAALVQVWGDWLDSMGHGLDITYTVEHNYHYLGQQNDDWRCGLFTVYNLLRFASCGIVKSAAQLGGQAKALSFMCGFMSTVMDAL